MSCIIIMNLCVCTKHFTDCIGEHVWKMNEFITIQQMLNLCRSFNFKIPKSLYSLFIFVLMFLNCRIRKILFCVEINGCIYFLVVFTYISDA